MNSKRKCDRGAGPKILEAYKGSRWLEGVVDDFGADRENLPPLGPWAEERAKGVEASVRFFEMHGARVDWDPFRRRVAEALAFIAVRWAVENPEPIALLDWQIGGARMPGVPEPDRHRMLKQTNLPRTMRRHVFMLARVRTWDRYVKLIKSRRNVHPEASNKKG